MGKTGLAIRVVSGFLFVFCGFCFGGFQSHYDLPKRKVKWKRVVTGEHARQINCFCLDYGNFSVYEERDPFNKGASEIAIRKVEKGDLCQRKHRGVNIPLSFGEGYFKGIVGNYAFVEGVDVFGDQVNLQIFQVHDGVKVFDGIRNSEKALLFEKKQGSVSASFYLGLKVSCHLAEEGDLCWRKIIQDNLISNSVGLESPDCKTPFQRAQSPLSNNALVSTKVIVKDLSKPEVVYVKEQVTCNPAP